MSNPRSKHPKPLHWVRVYLDLADGSLASLGDYVRETNGALNPMVASKLADLIDGPQARTGYRLGMMKHPDIGTKALGLEQSFARSKQERQIAYFMADAGGATRGQFDAALKATATRFEIGSTTIKAIWSKHKTLAKCRSLALQKLREQQSREGQNAGQNIDPQ